MSNAAHDMPANPQPRRYYGPVVVRVGDAEYRAEAELFFPDLPPDQPLPEPLIVTLVGEYTVTWSCR